MRVLVAFLGIGLVLAPSLAARAESTAAPFGLEWGMEVGGLGERNIPIQSTTHTGGLTVVNVREIPDTPEDTYLVNLLFDRTLGLVKVRWMSRDITGDDAGALGQRRYAEVRDYVARSYGEPTDEARVVGARLFDQEDEFYQCLAYEGCGVWSAIWEGQPSGGVLLSIEGLGPGSGFVRLDYESEAWQAAVAEAR